MRPDSPPLWMLRDASLSTMDRGKPQGSLEGRRPELVKLRSRFAAAQTPVIVPQVPTNTCLTPLYFNLLLA